MSDVDLKALLQLSIGDFLELRSLSAAMTWIEFNYFSFQIFEVEKYVIFTLNGFLDGLGFDR